MSKLESYVYALLDDTWKRARDIGGGTQVVRLLEQLHKRQLVKRRRDRDYGCWYYKRA